jgi:adenylate kinase family enzyme
MTGDREQRKKIHVMGASGAGVTTLGKALSRVLGSEHLDTDDFFWQPTDPPYLTSRSVEERISLLRTAFSRASQTGWILSGSLSRWGGAVVPLFDLVVFVDTPTELRIQRLRERESSRFGTAIAPGGPRHAQHEAFIAWAAGYDNEVYPSESHGVAIGTRNRARHEAWLLQLHCPVLRVDGARPVEILVDQVICALGEPIAIPARQC